MSYQSLSEKHSLLTKLIDIAKADAVVNIAEISYIFWIQQQLQLSDQELKNLFEKGTRHVSPSTLLERVEVFHKCITMMVLDNDISASELSICQKIALDLRLDKTQTETVLKIIPSKKGDIISLDEMKLHFGVRY